MDEGHPKNGYLSTGLGFHLWSKVKINPTDVQALEQLIRPHDLVLPMEAQHEFH